LTVGEEFGNARRIVLLGDVDSAPAGKVVAPSMIVILDVVNLKDCVKYRIVELTKAFCLKDRSIYGSNAASLTTPNFDMILSGFDVLISKI
jgi:hypothetical protein